MRRGAIAREEMTVATMLELSWRPLRKSKISARPMVNRIAVDNINSPCDSAQRHLDEGLV